MKRMSIIFVIYCFITASPVLSATGDVLSSFSAPSAGTTGLTYDGTDLWTVDTLNREFVQLSVSGSVISTFPLPVEVVTPVDIAYDGTNFYVTDKTGDRIFQLSSGGTVLSFFDCPCTQPMGITFDGTLTVGSGSADWLRAKYMQ